MIIGAGLKFIFDAITGSIVQIDNNHRKIHNGEHFLHSRFYSIADTATLNLVFEVGAKCAHIVYSAGSDTAGFTLSSYKTPAYDAGTGTIVPVFNNNQESTKVNTTIIRKDPTGLSTASAILFRTSSIGTATNPANSRAGSLARDDEVILPKNSKWLIAITNKSSSANPVNVNFSWYEED